MSAVIIDVATDVTAHLDSLFNAGYRTIFGYVSSINPGGAKCWTVARVNAAKAKGFRVGVVHEGWGGAPGHGGISAADGKRDGAYCRSVMTTLGAPRMAGCYFACDTDFNASEIASLGVPYFQAIKASSFGDGFYRSGAYGSGNLCQAVLGHALVSLTWEAQSTGWGGFNSFKPKASMVQGKDQTTAGVDLDTDTAPGDIGDFVPFSVQPAVPVVTAVAPQPSKLSAFLKSIGVG